MSNIWGRNLRLSIFGESHGDGLGIVIDGLPPGCTIDMNEVSRNMKRRAPGSSNLTTPRTEADEIEILSGIYNGITTGAPLCGIIRNTDIRSGDYTKHLPRPGTADLTAHIKYNGFNDPRGGGHFSGRLTAPVVFSGSIARQILYKKNVTIGAHIYKIGSSCDRLFDNYKSKPQAELLDRLTKSEFPLLDDTKSLPMKEVILRASDDNDSVGGIIECAATGQPAGLGSPFFESLESKLASLMFSIPGVKGIEFGDGFNMAEMKGSQINDQWFVDDDAITSDTNHSGGINGGITNGLPIIFRTVFRPTASIAKEQKTVDLCTRENATISIIGRHDPCIVPRAVVVVESALALCLLDLFMEGGCGL